MKLTKTITLETKEFGDFCVVKRPDRTFIVLRSDLPEDPNKLWDFKDWKRIYSFLDDEYLAAYHEGNWDHPLKSVDPVKAFEAGRIPYLNRIDGGLWFKADGTPLVRKIRCEFWRSYYGPNFEKLEKVLREHPQWSNLDVKKNIYQNYGISGTHTLVAGYLPTDEEMMEWHTRPRVSYTLQNVGHSFGVIHNKDYIKQFYVKQDYE